MGEQSGRRGPDPGEGGAPRTVIDVEIVKRAASIGCTAEEISALTGVPRSTFYLRMKLDEEFAAMVDNAREQGRATLRRLQWQQATNGNTGMLIWLGKQMLGQREHAELTGPGGGALQIDFRWADEPAPVTIDAQPVEQPTETVPDESDIRFIGECD